MNEFQFAPGGFIPGSPILIDVEAIRQGRWNFVYQGSPLDSRDASRVAAIADEELAAWAEFIADTKKSVGKAANWRFCDCPKRGGFCVMSELNLLRPPRVRDVYERLLAQESPHQIAEALGVDEDTARAVRAAINSHGSPGSSCTRHGTCLHSSWDMASQVIDIVDAR